jgi:hypothetical protein
MSPVSENHISGITKKSEIIYAHTYKHSKDTAEILKENMLYFEVYKKYKFLTKN